MPCHQDGMSPSRQRQRWPLATPRRLRLMTAGLVVLGAAFAPGCARRLLHSTRSFVAAAPESKLASAGRKLREVPGRAPAAWRRSAGTVMAERAVPTIAESSLQGRVQEAFAASLAKLGMPEGSKASVVAADPKFGDYQCNDAMALFKRQPREKGAAPRWKKPMDVGLEIKGSLPAESAEMLEEVNVSPQGFVTVKLSDAWVEKELRSQFDSGLQLRDETRQRIVIDYSSPNIAKEMHVGHLRSTILGHTAANLMESLGHDVVRLNHVGDWGTQFGMLLEYMRRGEGLGEDNMAIGSLQQFYRSAKKVFDEDADFKAAAQKNVVALQSGEPWAREAWQRICDASRAEFQLIYDRLGIQGLAERGESFYNPLLPAVVEELSAANLLEESDGAKCVFTSVSEAPLIIQKADGGYGYDSTDCAAVLQRLREEKADRIVYVIDNGQESHMRMVFEAAEKAEWVSGQRLDFMGFGLVQGEDGKKFKTRSGDVVRLKDLLDEASSRALVELQRRAGEDKERSDEEEAELRASAERIGVAAVKYFDLRQNRNSDYRFSYDSMLDPKGNTAVYVMYAYARMAAILRKAGREASEIDVGALKLGDPSERALALRLLRFPEMLGQVQEDLLPNRLIDYIYNVAGDFTSFYTACIVVGSKEEESRLALVEATRRVLKRALGLIGIDPLEKL